MECEAAIDRLREHEAELRRLGVERLYLFGSTAQASVRMAEASPVARLTDIIDAIELVCAEMDGVSLQAFEPDRRKRWPVERGIEIISEASRGLPDGTVTLTSVAAPDNPEWKCCADHATC
jgi:predicted nucleotidyltransferase